MATPIQSSPNVNNLEILLTGSIDIPLISRAIPANNPTISSVIVETAIPFIDGLFFTAGITSVDGGGFLLLPYTSTIYNSSSPYGMFISCFLSSLLYRNDATGNLELVFYATNANSTADEGPFLIRYYVMRNKL